MMNPAKVAQNRTARLVREAQTPTYSTRTGEVKAPRKPREHTKVVEIETPYGRHWSKPMPESAVENLLAGLSEDDHLSDIDCAFSCFCQPDED